MIKTFRGKCILYGKLVYTWDKPGKLQYWLRVTVYHERGNIWNALCYDDSLHPMGLHISYQGVLPNTTIRMHGLVGKVHVINYVVGTYG